MNPVTPVQHIWDDCEVCGWKGERPIGEPHHCDPKKLARIDAGRKGHGEELRGDRAPTFGERMALAETLLGLNEDDDGIGPTL